VPSNIAVLKATHQELEELAGKYDSVIVAYSGGKDSLTVMDLCVKHFHHVVGFHMHFVPGLKYIQERIDFARTRWKVEILDYIHWVAFSCLRRGVFCPVHYLTAGKMPEIKLADMHALVREDTGFELIAHGRKRSDSMWARRSLTKHFKKETIVFPLKHWNRWEVLAYLRLNNIPIPDGDGGNTGSSGIDLSVPPVLWLHDKHPEDFALLEKVFPYVKAIVKRRDWYGVN
jgi:hypothetical protein